MGLSELVGNVVTRYKANVDDHVRELKKLKGEERKRAEDLIKDNEKVSESLEGQIKTIGKIAVAVGAAYAAGKIAIESYRFALEESRLEQGAAGVSIDGLRKASAGLKSDMDLLRDAVKFKSAAFKLSQSDMEDLERAQRQLIRTGKDEQKVHEAINQALTKLSTEGLQELGINVQKAGLSMDDAKDRGQLFARVMEALHAESMKVNDAELTKQERMAQSGVAFTNATNDIKRAIAELVVSMAPLISKVAELVSAAAKLPGAVRGKVKDTTDMWKKGLNWSLDMIGIDEPYMDDDEGDTADNVGKTQALIRRAIRIDELRRAGKLDAAGNLASGMTEEGLQVGAAEVKPLADPNYKGKGARDSAAAKAASDAARLEAAQQALAWDQLKAHIGDWLRESQKAFNEQEEQRQQDAAGLEAWAGTQNSVLENLEAAWESMQEVGTRDQRYSKFTQSKLEQMFGPIEEFNRYAAAFGILQSAVTSAMDAWITGSESMGTAVKKAIGAGLKALAADLAIQALKHGAYAIGSLAFGDARGASLHGVAAAQFAAGSVAAAVAARAMGHGGTDYGKQSGAGGGAGSASPVGPRAPANNNAPAQSSVVYVVGDPFDTETNPRRRLSNAQKVLRSVSGNTAGGSY